MTSDAAITVFDREGPMKRTRAGLSATLKEWSLRIALLVVAVGCLVLVGWACDVTVLKRLIPGQPIVQASTGVSFVLCGLTLVFLNRARGRPVPTITGRILAVVVCLAGGLTFCEDLTQSMWNLDITWIRPHPDTAGLTFPGPMAPAFALNFFLIGLSLILLSVKSRLGIVPYQACALIASLLSMMTLIGYAAGLPGLCLGGDCIRIPGHESLLYCALCFSILFSRPDDGVMATFTADTLGGSLVRRISLAFLALPVLLWIKHMGERAGLFDTAFGWAMIAVLMVVALVTAVALNAATLDRMEASRTEAQKRLIQEAGAGSIDGQSTLAVPESKRRRRIKIMCPACLAEVRNDQKICPEDGATLVHVVDDPLIGTLFADRYKIDSFIGSGGMSSVYKAKHHFLNRDVAIKLMHSTVAASLYGTKRFLQEARAASALSHTNLIAIHDFGETIDGQSFLVMDYIDGQSLSELLTKKSVLPLPQLLDIAMQVLDGLAHAHEKGIVHRDLKPSNIMLLRVDDGVYQVKIVDFGMAKILQTEGTELQKVTQTGELCGSPLYMSPEQCMGTAVDSRSDIYSVGCILYECATGRTPFEDMNFYMTISNHVFKSPPQIPSEFEVPEWFEKSIYKALEKDPIARYQSALELKQVLQDGQECGKS